MADLQVHQVAVGDVTLVTAAVSAAVPERVRLSNRLDGPVWPPRSEGRPEPGWDEGGWTGRVQPDTRLVLGYACPAPPAEPPLALESPDSDAAEDEARDPAPTSLVRTLGASRPPADAVPGPRAAESRSNPGSDDSPGGAR